MALNAADNASRHSQSSHGSSFLGLTFRHGKPNSNELDEDAKGSLGLSLLHDASDPIVDFVFVHGLGGGSRKTWSYSSDLQCYGRDGSQKIRISMMSAIIHLATI